MAVDTMTSQFTLSLTEDERSQLCSFLEQALRDKLVEVHRTRAPEYRQHLLHEETVLERVLQKLRQT